MAPFTIVEMKENSPPLNYRDAGVDVAAGHSLVERIKPLAQSTRREGVMASLGGFGALFDLPLHRYRDPVLVSGTDGVGTKLRLALDYHRHDTVGIDLVAMCANDILAQGAEPLFFLDYFATGSLDIDVAQSVVSGIAAGCRQANAALIGGETAEMPGMYHDGDYDLAGFCVGIVERDGIIDGSRVAVGDRLLGLASSGPHSNGYSLIRRVIERAGPISQAQIDGRPLIDCLMEPTRIYVNDLQDALNQRLLKGIAHITGGGLIENVARILPPTCSAELENGAWPTPPVFDWIARGGNIRTSDMHQTFNCGLGMVVAVAQEHAEQALQALSKNGAGVFDVGRVVARDEGDPAVLVR
jgi:phosphoribosylformylglycinamidine cyclo-ligase